MHKIGIIMNGVTGRMGTHQHLVRSILAIRDQGGVALPGGDALMPDPVLVGRNEKKLAALAETHSIERWSTDVDECLDDPYNEIYFDSQTTTRRAQYVRAAIAAGKHVYCEKPSAPDVDSALRLARLAREAGVKHGVVQDKLFLPGLLKLRRLLESGFFGRLLSVRGEFGYWVYEGPEPPGQRPSWNYRAEDGGGILADMLPHWRYVLDDLFGAVRSVYTLGVTHIPERVDAANGAEEIVEHVAPVRQHVREDSAAVLGAVVPRRALAGRLGPLVDPVPELSSHREQASEEAALEKPAQLEQPREEQLVLYHAVLHAGLARQPRQPQRRVE